MNYQAIEAELRETDRMVREIMVRNDIITCVIGGLTAVLLIALIVFRWREHLEKMRAAKAEREWQDMQTVMYGAQPEEVPVMYRLH